MRKLKKLSILKVLHIRINWMSPFAIIAVSLRFVLHISFFAVLCLVEIPVTNAGNHVNPHMPGNPFFGT